MSEKTVMVRVPVALVEKFREGRKELEGLKVTTIVEVMLRLALKGSEDSQH